MTKEGYFEMCAALGNEPIPEEVPVDSSDLSFETVQALNCYGMLSDNWSGMGSYLGKHLADLFPIMKLNKVSDADMEYTIDTIRYIDKLVSEDIARQQKQASKK